MPSISKEKIKTCNELYKNKITKRRNTIHKKKQSKLQSIIINQEYKMKNRGINKIYKQVSLHRGTPFRQSDITEDINPWIGPIK